MEKIDINELDMEQICFQLILHSGNAKSKVIRALRLYREGKIEESEDLLRTAEEDLNIAHDVHFQLLQREASGNKIEFNLLLMHSEDHLMTAVTMKDLVRELLEIFKSIK